MPCYHVHLPGLGNAFVRMQAPRKKICRFCHRREATQLCDYPMGGKTCDKPICKECATVVGPDLDFCPDHKAQPAQQEMF
jgi:RNA polymerase subunit RPABC4/transcription elongation factor Spt4